MASHGCTDSSCAHSWWRRWKPADLTWSRTRLRCDRKECQHTNNGGRRELQPQRKPLVEGITGDPRS